MEKYTCSSHPESAIRECWDRQLNETEKAELKELIKHQTKTKVAAQTEALLKIARHQP